MKILSINTSITRTIMVQNKQGKTLEVIDYLDDDGKILDTRVMDPMTNSEITDPIMYGDVVAWLYTQSY